MAPSIRSNKSNEAGDLRDLAAGNAQLRKDAAVRAETGTEVANGQLVDSSGAAINSVSNLSLEEQVAAKRKVQEGP